MEAAIQRRPLKALGLIAAYLGDDVISHITGIKDAKTAWNELNKVFGT